MRLADERKVAPCKIHHVTAPEEAFQFVADGSCIAFLVKTGALLLAADGITVRPLAEESIALKTYLASRTDNKSKAASELVRAFMRKLNNLTKVFAARLRFVPKQCCFVNQRDSVPKIFQNYFSRKSDISPFTFAPR